MGRISIAGSLGFVAMFAIGFASLVNATSAWAGVVSTLTVGLLLGSVLAAILRGWRRGSWLGFALFGWGYFLIGSVPTIDASSSPWFLSDAAAGWIHLKSNPRPVPPTTWTAATTGEVMTPEEFAYQVATKGTVMTPEDFAYNAAWQAHSGRSAYATSIGRSLWVLIFAEVGAILGASLARGRRAVGAAPSPADGPDAEGRPAAPDNP